MNTMPQQTTSSCSSGLVADLDTPKEVHVGDQLWTWSNCLQKINWEHAPALTILPLIALYGLFFVHLQYNTFLWSVAYYFITGLGITAGYHRLWAHRAYTACLPLRIYLAITSAGALQGSIQWWCADHRAHHRFTDTSKDPYSTRDGVLYAHIGWLVIRRNPQKVGVADTTDLDNDPLVALQHKYFLPLSVFMAIILPTLVAGLGWADWQGGFFFAGVARLVVVHHATFCVNSVAHWLGDQPFDDKHTPRNHFITALITLGEGYHNFHHEFPNDYRNAIRFFQYDPTKWLILTLNFFGLADHLQTFSENEIQKGVVQMDLKKINERSSKLNWGTPQNDLPVVEFSEFIEMSKTQPLVLISGIVHDVTGMMEKHPGGRNMLRSGIGRDMTAAFNGGIYAHSNAAHNLLSTMRVAAVRGGMDVELWNVKNVKAS